MAVSYLQVSYGPRAVLFRDGGRVDARRNPAVDARGRRCQDGRAGRVQQAA
jgi:hypothetical protein